MNYTPRSKSQEKDVYSTDIGFFQLLEKRIRVSLIYDFRDMI